MAAGDLTTLANLKAYLGSNVGSYSDAWLSGVISAVSQQIQQWLSRTIASASYTDKFSGPGGISVLTRQYPITAVSAVSIDGVAVPASTTQTDAGYQFDKRKIQVRGYRFGRGVMNCSISYTAGYATTPADLEAAVWETCSIFLSSQGADSPALKMLRAGDTEQQTQIPGTVSGAAIGTIIASPNITSVLMPYRPAGFSY